MIYEMIIQNVTDPFNLFHLNDYAFEIIVKVNDRPSLYRSNNYTNIFRLFSG
jgi:hypothetical protein